MNDLVLALDLVRRLGEELSWGLFAQYEFPPISGRELVGGIRLPKRELQTV